MGRATPRLPCGLRDPRRIELLPVTVRFVVHCSHETDGSEDTRRDRTVARGRGRWLAARYPTQRAQEQTFAIAWRLNRGDTLFEA